MRETEGERQIDGQTEVPEAEKNRHREIEIGKD